MPSYVSVEGIFYPAKEKVSLKNITDKPKEIDGKIVEPGEPYIYEGADRAALFEMYKAGVSEFGGDFRYDSEFLNRIRNLGFKNVKEYLSYVGHDEVTAKEKAEKRAAKVNKHELPAKVKEISQLGGGIDTTGQGQDKYGGFGEPKN